MMNIYKEAIEVQDACNLSGVIHSFSKVMDEIWKEAKDNGEGTYYVNHHPVAIMFSSKISSLTGQNEVYGEPEHHSVNKAYVICEEKQHEVTS
jgi:hypothetical protein